MTIALLSHTYKQGNSGGSGTSPSIDTTGASLIVAYVADFTGSSPATFADSQGNTWTALTARPLTSNMRSQMYYCASPTTSASHTFSATGTNSFAAIAIAAYSGTATSPYDQETGATTLTGTSLATGSVTPSENNELVIYGCGYASSALSVSVGTMLDTAAIIGGTSYGIGLAYEIQTTATARSPSWSWSSSNSCSTTIATFKAAASGPTYTLTASGGSYTDTGGTAGLVAGRKIVASGGGYTHTGGTAALQAGRKLAASGGAFTETGGTAGLVVGRKLVADGGAYAFTGGDANLVYTPVGGATYTLSASGGTFALTGGDVAFLAARKLVVDGGAFALSGGDAAFTYPYDTAVPSKVGGDDVPRIEIYEKRKKKKRKDETLEAVIRNAMRGEPVEVKADTRQIEVELLALQIEQENEDLLALIL